MAEIAQAAIALVAALVAAFVIPWIKRKTTQQQQDNLSKWASLAAKAAEQIIQERGKGEEKKAMVLDFLEGLGLSVDEKTMDVIIESAVHEMNRLKA
jgi:hypothetical protein